MRAPRRRSVRTADTLAEVLAAGSDLRGLALQHFDLRAAPVDWARAELAGTLFLGCRLAPADRDTIEARGGAVFPRFQPRPYDPYRATLYTPEELCAPLAWEGRTASRDEQIHAWYEACGAFLPDVGEALAQRVHDHAIDEALSDLVGHTTEERLARRIVGIMGGHATPRGSAAYARAARVAWDLGRDHLIVTGGGPGIMEAGNLGAAFAGREEAALDAALARLDPARAGDAAGRDPVDAVLEGLPERRENVSVPTWFYGFEPVNRFATHVAKYFANSIREDGLLAMCLHGVVFADGGAGTVQEVFMDAEQNAYATFGYRSPMAFLGTERWAPAGGNGVHPALLREAAGYAELVGLSDDPGEVAAFIREHPPVAGPRAAG